MTASAGIPSPSGDYCKLIPRLTVVSCFKIQKEKKTSDRRNWARLYPSIILLFFSLKNRNHSYYLEVIG